MKTLLKIIAIAIVLLGIETSSFAQITVNTPTYATIVETIGLTLMNPGLDFGNLAVNGNNGYCILDPINGNPPTRTAFLGVTLPGLAFQGTPMAAEFQVSGAANEWFTITIPQDILTLTRVLGGGFTLTVDEYTTDQTMLTPPDTWHQQLGTPTGVATFYVGGTVHVPGGSAPGLYENLTGFPVTVNYQ